jgi:asparagine synthase (glutamine-hydrolysing)
MCGINGFNFTDQKLIDVMNNKIKHRGPDDIGTFIDNGVSFGHARLSIIDISDKGHQPMLSHDKRYIITYNGELYNFLDIKKDLEKKGYIFRSNSDTEVVLNAFIAYGTECLQQFNGIFSFAIWDKRDKKLFAARDHFGIKPFFYSWQNSKFIFSSEIKSILAHNISKELDYNALNLYFRFLYIVGPQTIFKHIKKLLPGHYILLKDNKLEIKQYYNLQSSLNNNSFQKNKELVRDSFDKAVKRQLVSDKPLGVFLSGGLDSTAILGSMSKIVDHQIKTFTVKFDIDIESKKFNEDSQLAAQTAKYYKTDHHELLVTAKDVVDNLEKVVYHMDDLVSNHVQTATYLLSKMAKEQVDVVLGGDGADEIFAGYQRYYYYNLIDKFQKIPRALRKNFLTKYLADLTKQNSSYRKLNADSNFDVWWQFRAQKEKIVSKFLKPDINNLSITKDILSERFFSKSVDSLATHLMQVDLQSWLVDESLTRSDKLTMAYGLEERIPILDKDLVKLAYNIPIKHKINNRDQGKFIFKEALRDYLPDYIYNKPKSGWFSPAAKWLRTDLKDMAYEVLSPDYNPACQELFDFVAIRKILDDHINKKQYALNTIWSLITWQIWYHQFKD